MTVTYKENGALLGASPNSVTIEIKGQRFQITEYVGQMKIVKIDGTDSDNIRIEPCVANSVLIF